MITNENLEHLEQMLEESGIIIPKEMLQDLFGKYSGDFQIRVNREGKNGLEDSMLFFNQAENGLYTHTEIKEKNFTYLANQLLDAEMPASVIPELRDGMRKGLAEIKIEVPQTIKNHDTLSTLNFTYYPTNGFHYWNNYEFQILDLQGQNAGMPQRVFVDNDKWTNTYTPTEMATLLMGESVTKELVSAEGKFYTQQKILDFDEVDRHENFKKAKAVADGPKQGSDKQPQAPGQGRDQKKNPTDTTTRNSRRKRKGMKH